MTQEKEEESPRPPDVSVPPTADLPPEPTPKMRDYFVSRRGQVASVAQEVAHVLEEAGHSVLVQDHDIPHGANFVSAMHEALRVCRHYVALLTMDFDSSKYTQAEWTNFFNKHLKDNRSRFVVLRVEKCDPPGLLSSLVYGDLVDVTDAQERKKRILAAAEGHSVALRQRPRIFGNVPAPNLNFTGREAVLTRLHARLGPAAIEAVPTVALNGLGGIGKTALAVQYAHSQAHDYAGVWWISAQSREGIRASLAALGRRLDPDAGRDENHERAAELTLQAFEERRGARFLLVYDNAESMEALNGLLPKGGASVLVTTRWSDWGSDGTGERLGPLEPEAARAFLEKRAGRKDPAGAARLASALGHLPLALEQAGAHCCRKPGFDDYAKKLGSLLAKAPHGYSVSVQDTFSIAIQEVVERVAAAERFLSFCAYLAPEAIPADLLSAEILEEDERDGAMMELCVVSLLEYTDFADAQPVFNIHKLVQAAARTRVEKRGEVVRQLTAVFRALERAFVPVRFWRSGGERRAELLPHVLRAREHLRGAGIPASVEAGRVLSRAGRYLQVHGEFAEAEALSREALAILTGTVGGADAEVAATLYDLVLLNASLERHEERKELLPRAIAAHEALLRDEGLQDRVQVLSNLANLLEKEGRRPAAAQRAREALACPEATPPERAALLNNLARFVADDAEKEAAWREAIALAAGSLGEEDESAARYRLALANHLRGTRKAAEAETLFRAGLTAFEKALGRKHPVVARAQRNFAELLLATKRPEEAAALAEQSLASLERGRSAQQWIQDARKTLEQARRATPRT